MNACQTCERTTVNSSPRLCDDCLIERRDHQRDKAVHRRRVGYLLYVGSLLELVGLNILTWVL